MRLLILDRDGVINEESEEFVKCAEEWRPLPGSLEALARATQAGFRVVVASNQSGLARGMLDIAALNEIHALMHRQLREFGGHLEAVFFCPHAPEDACDCRKPLPGMLLEITRRLRVAPESACAVGDRAIDIEAARAAGMQPVLVRTGHGLKTAMGGEIELEGIAIHDDLAGFVDHLLESSSTSTP